MHTFTAHLLLRRDDLSIALETLDVIESGYKEENKELCYYVDGKYVASIVDQGIAFDLASFLKKEIELLTPFVKR